MKPALRRFDSPVPSPGVLESSRRGLLGGHPWELSARRPPRLPAALLQQLMQVGDRIDDDFGVVRVAVQVRATGSTREDQDGVEAELDAAEDVRVHGVAD